MKWKMSPETTCSITTNTWFWCKNRYPSPQITNIMVYWFFWQGWGSSRPWDQLWDWFRQFWRPLVAGWRNKPPCASKLKKTERPDWNLIKFRYISIMLIRSSVQSITDEGVPQEGNTSGHKEASLTKPQSWATFGKVCHSPQCDLRHKDAKEIIAVRLPK